MGWTPGTYEVECQELGQTDVHFSGSGKAFSSATQRSLWILTQTEPLSRSVSSVRVCRNWEMNRCQGHAEQSQAWNWDLSAPFQVLCGSCSVCWTQTVAILPGTSLLAQAFHYKRNSLRICRARHKSVLPQEQELPMYLPTANQDHRLELLSEREFRFQALGSLTSGS